MLLFISFFVLFSFSETGFLCVVLAVLKLCFVDQAGLEFTEICLLLRVAGKILNEDCVAVNHVGSVVFRAENAGDGSECHS